MPASSRYDLYATRYPLLPLKSVVIFPHSIVTLLVGKPRSIQTVEAAMAHDHCLVVVTHRDPEIEDPQADDLHQVGTLVRISSLEPQPTGGYQVRLEGLQRVCIVTVDSQRPYLTARVEPFNEVLPAAAEAAILIRHLRELVNRCQELRGGLGDDVLALLRQTDDPAHFADLLATQVIREAARRQSFLENPDVLSRLEQLAIALTTEIDLAQLEQRIRDRVREQIDRSQREFYLREQLKVIHNELAGEAGSETEALRARIRELALPEEVTERLLREVDRLERMPAVSAEGALLRTYIETVLALPWNQETEDNLDLAHAQEILERDHYGLEQVKERIIEFLAVRKLTAGRNSSHPTILCFVGPPGVGKTSLGRSIATAMGRSFARVSLGGVRDEAEIRGHRRTYIGAYPGRIIGALRRAGTLNPVILLDEIDKLSADYRGDPAAALLEVLDPEQNRQFTDHYLDMPFDLSRVLFITTANTLSTVPRALRDRLEVIEIGGYTEQEKLEIGKRHLLPRQLEAHGLEPGTLEIPDATWRALIRGYTHEAGVRELERQIGAICRKVARDIVQGKDQRVRLTRRRLAQYLGPQRYDRTEPHREPQVGVALGLAATQVGGTVIAVEVAAMPGRGNLTITGQAGEIMQESARAALSYIRSRAAKLGLQPDFAERCDLHIHLPEGAQPKEGPSAGITMAIALISALTDRPVRADVAMTGEVTLRGRVLAVGGLKEKALAAHRAGIRHLIAPADNRRELSRLPEPVASELQFHWVSNMDEVLGIALLPAQPSDGLAVVGADGAITDAAAAAHGSPESAGEAVAGT
ncbi:endopeptidase La [Thermomicrobiaceae bacterium CFH 74404]|uniref:Lon protease n=1 Tax=Thermalbibacter longus TaxID=2951981 RepID=A0AA41W9J8_9BACT|nr:endopeptidase La [Thermalbibacter longus]MCM8747732.1 endopeptidase La [Thermalbibacter longus]